MRKNEISEVTRRSIVDYLVAAKVNWAGRLTDDEFLARLYDLTKLPSKDFRFHTAAADIHQHTVNWSDWPTSWVFFDSRFNLLHASDTEFLRFLSETVHPVVRADASEATELVDTYNQALVADGWSIVEKASIAGRPVYHAARLDGRAEVFAEPTGWEKVDR